MSETNMPIFVLTTGGTLDKHYFDALSEYKVGETTVGRMLETGRVAKPFEIRELMRKDSLELTDADRDIIRKAVLDTPNQARIVITHGSDTMTQSAQALGDVGERRVAFVGALAPARFADSDAPFNLGMAFATVQTASAGVYITMSGEVFRAGDVFKDRDAGRFVRLTRSVE